MKFLIALMSFITVAASGFFVAWIGDVRPFSNAAGFSALMTLMVAFWAFGMVIFLYESE